MSETLLHLALGHPTTLAFLSPYSLLFNDSFLSAPFVNITWEPFSVYIHSLVDLIHHMTLSTICMPTIPNLYFQAGPYPWTPNLSVQLPALPLQLDGRGITLGRTMGQLLTVMGWALAMWLNWLECCSMHQSCRFDSWSGPMVGAHTGGNQVMFLPHIDVSLSPPSSLSKSPLVWI